MEVELPKLFFFSPGGGGAPPPRGGGEKFWGGGGGGGNENKDRKIALLSLYLYCTLFENPGGPRPPMPMHAPKTCAIELQLSVKLLRATPVQRYLTCNGKADEHLLQFT